MKLKTFSKWLVIVGALEVGFMSVLKFDLVGTLLGSWPMVVKALYILVLLSALWGIFAMLIKNTKK